MIQIHNDIPLPAYTYHKGEPTQNSLTVPFFLFYFPYASSFDSFSSLASVPQRRNIQSSIMSRGRGQKEREREGEREGKTNNKIINLWSSAAKGCCFYSVLWHLLAIRWMLHREWLTRTKIGCICERDRGKWLISRHFICVMLDSGY